MIPERDIGQFNPVCAAACGPPHTVPEVQRNVEGSRRLDAFSALPAADGTLHNPWKQFSKAAARHGYVPAFLIPAIS